MKRIISLVLAVSMVCIISTGCSKSSSTNTKSSTPPSTSTAPAAKATETPKRTINFWHTFGSGVNAETINSQVDQFNKKFEGKIEVVATYQGNYAEALSKYMTSIAAKNNPEIGVCDSPDTPRLIKQNVVENLSPLIKKDNVNINDYIEGLLLYSKSKDNIYAMPFCRSTPIMYYNKDLFRKVLGTDKAPETWDDILNAARKFKAAGIPGICFEIENWYYGALISAMGGSFLSEDGTQALLTKNDVGLKALKFWRQLVDEGLYVVPPLTSAGTFMLQEFYQGKLGILLQSTGNIGSVIKNTEGKFEYGGAFMPKMESRGFSTGGGNLVLFSRNEASQKEAGWELMKFLTTPELNGEFSKATGYMITRKSGKDLPLIKELWAQKPIYKVSYDQLEFVKDSYVSADWAELNLEIKKTLQAMIQDNKLSPEQAYEEIKTACKTILPNGYAK